MDAAAERLEKEAAAERSMMDRDLCRRIEAMQARHERIRKKIVDWAVERIAGE